MAIALGGCGATKMIGELEESGDGSGDGSSDEEGSASATSTSGEPTASGTATSTSGDPTATSGVTSTSGDPTATATSTSEDTGGTTGMCDGGSVCNPQPEDVDASFTITPSGPPGQDSTNLDMPCTVTAVEGEPPQATTFTLACTDNLDTPVEYTIELVVNGIVLFNLYPGAEVELSHIVRWPFWVEEWFKIRWAGSPNSLLLAGSHGSGIHPPGFDPFPDPSWYAPLLLTVEDDVCEVEPECGEQSCYQPRRHAIAADSMIAPLRSPILVYDHGVDYVPGSPTFHEIRVETAEARENMQCDDVPDQWYELIVSDVTEG